MGKKKAKTPVLKTVRPKYFQDPEKWWKEMNDLLDRLGVAYPTPPEKETVLKKKYKYRPRKSKQAV